MNRQEIRIAIWNANGITQTQGKLQVFLDTNKIDIDLISEISDQTVLY